MKEYKMDLNLTKEKRTVNTINGWNTVDDSPCPHSLGKYLIHPLHGGKDAYEVAEWNGEYFKTVEPFHAQIVYISPNEVAWHEIIEYYIGE